MSQIKFIALLLLSCSTPGFAQKSINELVDAEYKAGHFSGTLLAVKDGRLVAQVSRGEANIQFHVPVTATTRFPIASVTKLFTAILTLQLVEKLRLQLGAKVAEYLPDLPPDCRQITIADLLTHYSGLRNEPLKAYQAAYTPAEFVKRFVARDSSKTSPTFNYNNVDYILLTRILESVTHQSFAQLVQANILTPLRMADSGVISEPRITPRLAYGYHNYTFGAGTSRDTLRNDSPKYLSTYAGAGALYATAADLYKLVQALKANTLLSAQTTATYLLKPQRAPFVAYARGNPTVGFYYNDKTFANPVLERRGSISGFNAALLTNLEFTKVVIIVTNTDMGDLEKIGDQAYSLLSQ